MIDYRNILFCTDFSEDAEIAFVHAADLAERHGAVLHVLHVLPSLHRYLPTETRRRPDSEEVEEATPQVIGEAGAKLKERYRPRLGGVREAYFEVRAGTPYVEILRYARDVEVELIVLGASGAGEREPTHYGNTVEQVSRRAHCHVMAIRNPEKTYTL
jgi:nucleotide-binding universal stress UspA family protein